jgi:hypothetical protein
MEMSAEKNEAPEVKDDDCVVEEKENEETLAKECEASCASPTNKNNQSENVKAFTENDISNQIDKEMNEDKHNEDDDLQ